MPAPHGRGIWGKRTGTICCDVLDAWFEPSPLVRAAVGRSLDLIGVSPDVELLALRKAVSDIRGVDFDSISFGAGSSEIIHRVMPKLVGGGKAVVLDPTYSEYRYVLSRIGCTIESLALSAETSFNVDVNDLIALCRDADLVVIVNPNNPTGRAIFKDDLLELRAAMRKDAVLWIDEAYIDYCEGDYSIEHFACEIENVYVLKSLSKAYALSGMRAAYLLATPESTRKVADETPPWIIGTLAQIAAVEALRDEAYYKPLWKETVALAADLAKRLRIAGLCATSGSLNAVLVKSPGASANSWAERLAESGLIVRTTTGMGVVLADEYVRISVVAPDVIAKVVEMVGGTGLEPVTPSV